MHADRTNRVVLTLIGLIALALGVAALVAGFGGFGTHFRHRSVTANGVSHYFSDHGYWLWPVIAAGALIITLLALLWVARLLFSTDRTGDIRVVRNPQDRQLSKGRTNLQASALTSAVCSEIETYHGVTATNGRVIDDPASPTLVITVSISRYVDVLELVHRIDSEALAHARQALDDDQFAIELNINVTDKESARSL